MFSTSMWLWTQRRQHRAARRRSDTGSWRTLIISSRQTRRAALRSSRCSLCLLFLRLFPCFLELYLSLSVVMLATWPAWVVNVTNNTQWGFIGANLDHLSKSISAAPIAHSTFFGSILAMEGLFFLYYSSWSLFKVLPVAGVIGLSIFLSGSKALSEVQSRRLTVDR